MINFDMKKQLRLTKYSMKNLNQYIMLIIEITAAIVLLSIVIAGSLISNNTEKYFQKYRNSYEISISATNPDVPDSEEEASYNELMTQHADNIGMSMWAKVGKDWFSDDNKIVAIIDDGMANNIKFDMAAGENFTGEKNNEYYELILADKFSRQYDVGEVVLGSKLFKYDNTMPNIQYDIDLYNASFKIMGFIPAHEVLVLPAYNFTTSFDYIVCDPDVNNSFNYAGLTYFGDDIDSVVGSIPHLIKGVNIYEQTFLSDFKSSFDQVMSFMKMFAMFAGVFFISTILSASVLKYNYNVDKSKLMHRMGVSKREMLINNLMILVGVLIVSILFSIIVTVLIAPAMMETFKGAVFIIKPLYVTLSALIVSSIYVISEACQAFCIQSAIKKERK